MKHPKPRLVVRRVAEMLGEFRGEDERVLSIKPSEIAARIASTRGYSPVLVQKYIEVLGEAEALDLVRWNEKPLPETIRCNDYLAPCSELEERLSQKGFSLARIPWLPHGIEVLEQPVSVGATHEYLQGLYYIQDPGSMTVAYLLDPRPGETIVDMAAAPGGKATQIQQLTWDSSTLVAVDVSRKRMRALRSNMQRMGFKNYVAIRADSRMLPQLAGAGWADRVLLDAPSTGEGIIRKDPSRKSSRSQTDVLLVHYMQLEMLYSAVEIVKPGGLVLYSACSTSPEEGEMVVSRLLTLRSDVEVEDLNPPLGSPGVTEYMGFRLDPRVRRCSRLWPHLHGTEGFFLCAIRRSLWP